MGEGGEGGGREHERGRRERKLDFGELSRAGAVWCLSRLPLSFCDSPRRLLENTYESAATVCWIQSFRPHFSPGVRALRRNPWNRPALRITFFPGKVPVVP